MKHISCFCFIYESYLSHENHIPIAGPVKAALKKLGADISDARKRRRIPTILMAERSFISRATLGRLEKGDPSVSLGNYAAVLFVLGLTD
ncbi:MAG: hypothetical protein RRY13_08695, partial [Akkermansia sp.]